MTIAAVSGVNFLYKCGGEHRLTWSTGILDFRAKDLFIQNMLALTLSPNRTLNRQRRCHCPHLLNGNFPVPARKFLQ